MIRLVIARCRDFNEENFSNLSAQRSSLLSLVVFALALNTSLRTSGSLVLSSIVSSFDCFISGFLRKSGPASQLVSIILLGMTPRIAKSVGLCSLSTYLHCSGVDKLLIISTLLAT